MKIFFACFISFITIVTSAEEETLPAWAYAQNPPNNLVVPQDNSLRRVPNSEIIYSYSQVKDLFFAPDWHPQDHPPLPNIVSQGRKPDLFACGVCHRANGSGGPENASLTGLNKSYLIQQMSNFKNGTRTSSIPSRAPVKSMISLAKAANEMEIELAADYFSKLRPQKNISVIETHRVPVTFERGWHLATTNSGQTEPIGNRIIEVPDQLENFISRDSRATFTAYVPKGSLKKGRALTKAPNTHCETCHGNKLVGSEIAPRLAGRSPSYIVRQLIDFKLGSRAGAKSQAMKEITKNLSLENIISIAAYSASLPPR